MKDLKYTCVGPKETYISASYDTIMDFTDAYENPNLKLSSADYRNIEADFFENPLLHKHFESITALYNYCKTILK